MAKFIIEVDDDFIRENANVNLSGKVDPRAPAGKVLKAIFDKMAFHLIKKKLDEGVTEFRVSRDMMDDDVKREYYDTNVADVLMLAYMAETEAKEG